MATGTSAELVGVFDGSVNPAKKSDGRVYDARLRAYQAAFDLAATTNKTAVGDNNHIVRVPHGTKPKLFLLDTTVSLGTATISIGTMANPAKYMAARTLTTTDSPIPVMAAAAAAQDVSGTFEDVYLFITTAALPAAGKLVIDTICSGR